MNDLSKMTPDHLSFRDAITFAENIILSVPQLELEVIHHFSPGIYAREMRIPKHTILTGKIHKTEHLCIMHGDIEIVSEEGQKRLTGFHIFNSMPGIKRIGSTHEDTVFVTIHQSELTNIDELEEALVVDTYEQYEQFLIAQTKQLGAL